MDQVNDYTIKLDLGNDITQYIGSFNLCSRHKLNEENRMLSIYKDDSVVAYLHDVESIKLDSSYSNKCGTISINDYNVLIKVADYSSEFTEF